MPAASRSTNCKYEYPDEPVPPGKTPQQHLEDLDLGRRRRRYPGRHPGRISDDVQTRLAEELALIAKLDYARYFLTVHDVVAYARKRRHPLPGPRLGGQQRRVLLPRHHRGQPDRDQAAVRPLHLGASRGEPPDIDVDFEHERREEVIQYVYKRYGRDRAAICATVIHYRPRSAIREVGKALGLTEDVTAALAKTVWGSGDDELPDDHIRQAGLDPTIPAIRQAVALADAADRLSAPSLPARRRLRAHPRAARRDRADRQRRHGGPHLHRMGQGRHRHARPDEGRCAGARHAELPAPRASTCSKRTTASDITLASIPRRHGRRAASTRCSPAPIRSACSRSRAARRCRCCRGSSRECSTISSSKWRSCGRARSRATWCIPICAAATGSSRVTIPRPIRRRACDELEDVLKRTLGVPLFQEQAMQIAIDRRGVHAGRGRRPAPRHGDLPPQRHRRISSRQVHRRHDAARLCARFRRALLQPDRGLRRIRLSREPRGELRAAGLRLGLDQVPLPGRVLRRHPQQPADGLLPAGPAGARRARARRRGAGRRRQFQRLGLHAGAERTAATPCASASGSSAGCGEGAGKAHRGARQRLCLDRAARRGRRRVALHHRAARRGRRLPLARARPARGAVGGAAARRIGIRTARRIASAETERPAAAASPRT